MSIKNDGWIVKATYDERDIENASGAEIAVVRKKNLLGQTSLGWAGPDKIILFNEGHGNFETCNLTWCIDVANAVCTALNKEGL